MGFFSFLSDWVMVCFRLILNLIVVRDFRLRGFWVGFKQKCFQMFFCQNSDIVVKVKENYGYCLGNKG